MKIDFKSDNKSKTNSDFPKLAFQSPGELARIAVVEPSPEVGFVHTLKAPSILNGEIEMETVTGKDGSSYQKVKTNFVGRHICFGNPEILGDKGKDPANCLTCAAANENDAISPAERRFAMHVIRYSLQPGGYKVKQPFSAELVVWTFTNKMFDQLTDIAEEHGGITNKDLLLKCTNKTFQNVDIQPGSEAVWRLSDDNQKFVKELYAANKFDDLTPAMARAISRSMAQEDIDKVLMKTAQAYGRSGATDTSIASSSEVASAVSLDEMLGESAPATSEPEDPWGTPAANDDAPAKKIESIDDLLAGL